MIPAILISNSSIEFPQVPAPRRSKESCSACSRRRTDSTWRSIEAGVACENKYSHWNSHHTFVVKGSASAYVCYYAVQLKLLVVEDALFPHGSLVTSWGGQLGVGTSYNRNPFEITEKQHFMRTSSRMKALVMCCGHTLGWPYPHQQSKSYRRIPQKLPAFWMHLSSLVGNCIRSWEQYGKIRTTVDTGACPMAQSYDKITASKRFFRCFRVVPCTVFCFESPQHGVGTRSSFGLVPAMYILILLEVKLQE